MNGPWRSGGGLNRRWDRPTTQHFSTASAKSVVTTTKGIRNSSNHRERIFFESKMLKLTTLI